MSEATKAEQSVEDKTESITNEPVAMKETDIGSENVAMKETDLGSENIATIEADLGRDKCMEDKQEIEQEEDEETEGSVEDDDEHETTLQPNSINVYDDDSKDLHKEVYPEKKFDEDKDSRANVAQNNKNVQMENAVASVNNGDTLLPEACSKNNFGENQKPPANDEVSPQEDKEKDSKAKLEVCDSLNHQNGDNETISKTSVEVAPNTRSSPLKVEILKEEPESDAKDEGPLDAGSENPSNYFMFDTDTLGVGESGTEDEQSAFIMELIKFHKERGLDFRPPKFYGGKLNLLKLWRAVLKLGGYDKVTACKYWRQVGESFKPPKTCTTVSWTFRIFYEKALLDYERYRTRTDGSGLSYPIGSESQGPGSGRAIRDAAARAMQGWHSQRVLDNGEVSDPIIKDKNPIPKEKPLKSLDNLLKRKKPSTTDSSVKAVPMKLPKTHRSDATVIDIGSPADWVKINVRVTRDCYEVYALVPGLLREEVRVQSDPAGRLVISGEPENPDNPWNVTPFKKVVSLPSRIDPHQTSAVVTLHGQLFVRVPFEQYD